MFGWTDYHAQREWVNECAVTAARIYRIQFVEIYWTNDNQHLLTVRQPTLCTHEWKEEEEKKSLDVGISQRLYIRFCSASFFFTHTSELNFLFILLQYSESHSHLNASALYTKCSRMLLIFLTLSSSRVVIYLCTHFFLLNILSYVARYIIYLYQCSDKTKRYDSK